MGTLGSLEEIAEQTSFRFNAGTRQRQTKCKWGHVVPPNLTHAKVAREGNAIEKPAALIPAARLDEDEKDTVQTMDGQGGPQEARIISESVTCYTELIAGIQARVGELGICQADFDKLAGFADGLTGKAFGPSQVKRLGPEKLFDAIRAAALRLRLEADPEQLERMQKQIAENCQPRRANQARMGNRSHLNNKIITEVLGYLANKRGGLTVLNNAVREARSNCARRGARALWEKRRACGPVNPTCAAVNAA
jgi:hypothetical protein